MPSFKTTHFRLQGIYKHVQQIKHSREKKLHIKKGLDYRKILRCNFVRNTSINTSIQIEKIQHQKIYDFLKKNYRKIFDSRNKQS